MHDIIANLKGIKSSSVDVDNVQSVDGPLVESTFNSKMVARQKVRLVALEKRASEMFIDGHAEEIRRTHSVIMDHADKIIETKSTAVWCLLKHGALNIALSFLQGQNTSQSAAMKAVDSLSSRCMKTALATLGSLGFQVLLDKERLHAQDAIFTGLALLRDKLLIMLKE